MIVYNNSEARYTLRVDGGILVDDSGQTLTAQEGVATPVAEAGEAGEEEAALRQPAKRRIRLRLL